MKKRVSIALPASTVDNIRQSQKTLIVIGVVRGGTSMVSGLLRGMGVFMGDDLDNNHEDPIFVSRKRPLIRETIEHRNKNHGIWGWKYPEAAYYLDDIWQEIRNPYLICVQRDAAANASAQVRWHNKKPLKAMSDVLLDSQRNLSLISRKDCPRLVVSYEKAILNPDTFVSELEEFTCLKMKHDFDYRSFMAPGKYKNI